MEQYPSNSQKAKTPDKSEVKAEKSEKKVEKVITGETVRRKKTLGKRFTETFVGGDPKDVAKHTLVDVLIPAAKDMIVDAAIQGVNQLVYGETRRVGRNASSSGGFSTSRTKYNGFSSSLARREDPRAPLTRKARATHDFDDILIETRAEAEEVLDRLFSLISKYDAATVADFYELVGQTGSFTDEKWGWEDIRGANVQRTRGGWLVNLPRPEPLD